MKHLKTFETVYPIVTNNYTENKEPEIGDYVICKDEALHQFSDEDDTQLFLSTNIGRIKRYTTQKDYVLTRYKYLVVYKNVPKKIKHNFIDRETGRIGRPFSLSEIIAFSSNKEELEALLAQNKYNL